MDRKTDVFTLINAQVITASGQTNAFSVGEFTEAQLLIAVSATGGTNPTLDFIVQVSDASDGTFHQHTAVTQITSNGNKNAVLLTNIGRQLRLSYTIGGTGSPTFTITAKLICKN